MRGVAADGDQQALRNAVASCGHVGMPLSLRDQRAARVRPRAALDGATMHAGAASAVRTCAGADLRIGSRSGDRGDDCGRSPAAACREQPRRDARRVCMRAEADAPGRAGAPPTSRRPARSRSRSSRTAGSIIGCGRPAGEFVGAEIEQAIVIAAVGRERGRRPAPARSRRRCVRRSTQDHLRLGAQRAAGEQPDDRTRARRRGRVGGFDIESAALRFAQRVGGGCRSVGARCAFAGRSRLGGAEEADGEALRALRRPGRAPRGRRPDAAASRSARHVASSGSASSRSSAISVEMPPTSWLEIAAADADRLRDAAGPPARSGRRLPACRCRRRR